MINIKKLNIQEKIKLFKELYKDIAGEGIGGDTELAHINKFESTLLKSVGGQGSINPTTGLKQYLWWWWRRRRWLRYTNYNCKRSTRS